MYKHKVQYYETDMMGITHHSNYIRWMEESRTYYLSTLGWPYKKMEDEGFVSPIIHVECDYRKTTTYDDVIDITPSIYEFKGVKIKFNYIMTNEAGETVFIAKSEHCFLNNKGKPINLKKVKPELYQVIVDNIQPL